MRKVKLVTLFLVGILVSLVSAAEVEPLYFTYISQADSQQAEWDYLVAYKLFGATGIRFKGQDIKITDLSGWFGTARGDFIMGNDDGLPNGNIWVGGPILIGGDMSLDMGPDTLTSGSVRVTGKVLAPVDGFDTMPNYIAGPQCVQGTVDSKYEKLVSKANQYFGTNYGNCPTTVPEIRPNLSIPNLAGEHTYQSAISVNNSTAYIDVPEGEGVYDLYIEKISVLNDGRIYIRMPAGGRLTRIFLKYGIDLENGHPKIQVQYNDGSGNYQTLSNHDYSGNLLFYTDRDINFASFLGTDTIQGTFITTGNITLSHHLTLAGQLLADYILVEDDFDGKQLLYVPFDPPILSIEPQLLTPLEFSENDSLVKVPIVLDMPAFVDINFDYCFDLDNSTATIDDVTLVGGYSFPLCSQGRSAQVVIPLGETASADDPSKSIWIKVKNDNVVEGTETLRLKIFNLSGAMLPGDKREGYFDLILNDGAVSEPLVFAKDSLGGVRENAASGTLIDTLQANLGSEKCTNCTFSIVGANNYITVTEGGVVMVKNAAFLDYETIQYVKATVRVSDEGSRTADTTIVIPVYDMNEAPVVQDVIFVVNENSAAGTVVGEVAASDPDVYHSAYRTLTYSFVSGSTQFNINSGTGMITVAADDALDYEKASIYTLRVRVTDGELSDTAVVTVKVADVNELPEENPDEQQLQETIDCINYEGSPDARCAYTRLESGTKGLGLYIVAAGEESNPANALANTGFYVYAPKASSDSVVISLASDGTEIGHMSKVTSNDAGLAIITVNALYPISNFEIGTASSVDSNATIVRVYNFYVPGVQYCLDENCNEPITDKTSLRPSVGEDLVIYARAYIPMGPSKGATDTTLQKTFYIKSLAAGENLRYYNVNGIELPSRPFGYQIDFINGRAAFVVRATGDVASGSAFSMNSYVDFAVPGDTSFLVTEAFPGSIFVADAEEPGGDSISTLDTSEVATDTSEVVTDTGEVAADTTASDSTEVDSGENSGDSSDEDPGNSSEEPRKPGDIKFAMPSFRIVMTGMFQFTIVMDDSIATLPRDYAVMNLQGRVLRKGAMASNETAVPLPGKGSYIVKVGRGYRRVNVR